MKVKFRVESINVKEGIIRKGKNKGQTWRRFGLCDGEEWYNFFADSWNEELQSVQEGDEVEVYVKPKEYNGRTSMEIIDPNSRDAKTAQRDDALAKKVAELEARLEIVEARFEGDDDGEYPKIEGEE